MFHTANRSILTLAVFLGCLALAVAGGAQTKGKTDERNKGATKSAAALKAEEDYKTVCQACHLADGKGLTPDMSFTDGVWKHGSSLKEIANTIREGVPGTLMVSFKDKFPDAEIAELAKLVKAFDPKKPAAKTTKKQ